MLACAMAIVRPTLLSVFKEAERGWCLAVVVCELPNARLSGRRHSVGRSTWRSTAVRSSRLLCDRSPNHFVGTGRDRWRQRQPQGLGGLQVDDELKLGGLFDGEISGPGSFENLVD